MNKNGLITSLVLVNVILLFGCGGAKKEKNTALGVPVKEGEHYSIDTAKSVLTWTGSMKLTGEKHIGYVYISKGELLVADDRLAGGTAEIDMNSIEYADKSNTNTPVHHLKSPDYFDVAKFPTSKIAITKVVPENDTALLITGNLTILDVTRPVTFPATFTLNEGTINTSGKLVIDRTDWGIRYRSGKFYDKFADQVVSDEMEFEIKIIAKK
jgi:polyisoprenoid-binding protein YceI